MVSPWLHVVKPLDSWQDIHQTERHWDYGLVPSGFLDQLGLEEDRRQPLFSDRFTMESSVRLVVEVSVRL